MVTMPRVMMKAGLPWAGREALAGDRRQPGPGTLRDNGARDGGVDLVDRSACDLADRLRRRRVDQGEGGAHAKAPSRRRPA